MQQRHHDNNNSSSNNHHEHVPQAVTNPKTLSTTTFILIIAIVIINECHIIITKAATIFYIFDVADVVVGFSNNTFTLNPYNEIEIKGGQRQWQ